MRKTECNRSENECRPIRHSSFVTRNWPAWPALSFVIAFAFALLSAIAKAETVKIDSAADWDNFATRVNNGESSLNAVLMRDVTLTRSSPRCGISGTRYYKGEFDGNGKTLTVDIKLTNAGADNPAALFAHVTTGFNVHDLHVAGKIETDGKFAAGIYGRPVANSLEGTISLRRCRVSADFTLTVNGDATAGGLGALANYRPPNVDIADCLFDGSMTGANASCSGGLIGYRYSSRVYTANCLFSPTSFNLDADDSYTLVRGNPNGYYADSDCKNSWYTLTYGKVQGSDGHDKTAEELVAALGSNWKVENGKAVPKMVVSFESNNGLAEFAYHGVLRDAQGNRLERKDYTIAFRIYDQAAGGSPHWGRKVPVRLDDDGLFSVELSDTTDAAGIIDGVPSEGLSNVLANNSASPLYIGLTVETDGGNGAEIAPRQRLIAAPYAAIAEDGLAASGDMAVSGQVAANAFMVRETLQASAITADEGGTVSALATAGDANVGGDVSVRGSVNGNGAFPVGGILVWSGAENAIPDGWALCNGQTVNGRRTPDLRSRFIVGAGGSYGVGSTGGEKQHRLTVNEIPSHRHEYVGDDQLSGIDGSWTYSIRKTSSGYDAESRLSGASQVYGTRSVGGDEAHENRPPFYALCYIMRVR